MRRQLAFVSLFVAVMATTNPAYSSAQNSATYSLRTETLSPKSGTAKRIVIVLHASEGHSEYMRHIASTLRESLPDTVFLIPNGPFPAGVPERYHWFSEPSEKGARDGEAALNRYIDEVKKQFSVGDDQIAVVGSSAGGMIAFYTVQRRAQPMAAIVGFASTVVNPPPVGHATPVCMIYGNKDHFYTALVKSAQMLRDRKIAVEEHVRPDLGHEVDMPGVAIAAQCLQKSFGIR